MSIPPLKYTTTMFLPQELVSEEFAAILGSTQIANIRRRLQRGENVNDAHMPGYSKQTKAQRKKRGRQTKFRDLTMTGRMIGDMHVADVRVTGSLAEAIIGFTTARGRQLALAHQARDPWFGVSPKDRASLEATARQQLPEHIQKNLDKPTK